MRRSKKRVVTIRPVVREMGEGGASMDWDGSGVRQKSKPAKRPVAMAMRVAKGVGRKSVMAAAPMAMAMRVRLGARERCMERTAWATMATATSSRPWRARKAMGPVKRLWPKAKANMSSAEGRVKPSQAASPPGSPPRRRPRAKPVWLLAGPGRDWASAMISA